MRIILLLLFIISSFTFFNCASQQTTTPTATSNPAGKYDPNSYYGMVERIKNWDLSVNFKTLRMLYTKQPEYNPVIDQEERKYQFSSELERGNVEDALKTVNNILSKNYVDILAHRYCSQIYLFKSKQDDYSESERKLFKKKYEHHKAIAEGLTWSILSSGDGKSPQTSYLVINKTEQYIVLNSFGYQFQSKKRFRFKGHWYEQFVVLDRKEKPKKIFFNIDKPYNWMRKRLE